MRADNRRRMKLAANFLLFQTAWFWCVLAPVGWDAAGGALLFVVHLRYIAAPREWRALMIVTIAGAAMDSALITAGLLRFTPEAVLAPPWLIVMWCHFASTLPHSLRWLSRNRLLAAAGGALFAPPAYHGAVALSDKCDIPVSFLQFAAVQAPLWALLMPTAFFIVHVFDKKRT